MRQAIWLAHDIERAHVEQRPMKARLACLLCVLAIAVSGAAVLLVLDWRQRYSWREIDHWVSPNGSYVAVACIRPAFEDWAVALRSTSEQAPGTLISGWNRQNYHLEWQDEHTLLVVPIAPRSDWWCEPSWGDVVVKVR